MATSLNTSRPAKDLPGSAAVPRLTALTAAYTMTDADDGKTFTLGTATGFAVTLPAASGSGFRARFVVTTSASGGSYTIVAAGSDKMNGFAHLFGDDTSALGGFATTAGTATTVTMDGSTRGGFIGDVVEVEDIASALWQVRIFGHATGTEATPFS